ncbi:hypothetical protein [Belnapia moabensis]|uniref:hypothetical protein n=1 Tax=Belnapia moabensis TaxID=365533 RepID=UPI0012ED5C3B|nr:hypothetical protein [Belnapia moabensis]
MIAHVNGDGRFFGYEYRDGVTPMNRRGSRGGTVNLSPSGRARWQAENNAGRDFRLPQQPC